MTILDLHRIQIQCENQDDLKLFKSKNYIHKRAMKSKFYLTLLAIFGSITISGFYLGENILKVVGLAVTVPVGILSLLSLI